MAAGHRACRHAIPAVATIHGSIRGGRRFAMVMFGDRAVVSGTASHAARGPCGSGEWGVHKHDREETEARGKDGPAALTTSSHGVH
jgi:hypothetical protein